ncbi:DASS family sodium-coupled anion symporter [Methylonatrum kenyense]|uniref:SLC13 family permease n=1 Tax=Methylonatrum kenyense TaxID=455253 RepID=UPI0020C00B77|nr:DASS family sodium-coupled anion symporter [Methylonatrum kenyense]MCK8517158.1 DASS family sodium-coupled anion symporter [Methylonatrum kenyense]
MIPSNASAERRSQWLGLALGPLLAALVYWLIPDADSGGLEPAGRATAAVGVLMATWWLSEALPLPATALLPLALFPLLGISNSADAAAPYASDVIFLFMAGFLLGLGMERWGLHRRVALRIIVAVGTAPKRLVAGFMLAAAILSMWISNTAATIILLPVAVSIVRMLQNPAQDDQATVARFATCLVLAIAYSASIGGVGTLIGSPPNLVAAGFLERQLDCSIGMLDWMRFGLPLVVVFLPLAWAYLVWFAFPLRMHHASGDTQVRQQLDLLGRMSRGEKVISFVFGLTALGWILRPQLNAVPGLELLSDAAIGMIGALSLFLIPVHRGARAMDWDTALRLPWGVLLLFGGGLSLAAAIGSHDVDLFIAGGIRALGDIPLWALLLLAVTLVKFMTELTSNTAIATTFIPVLAAVAVGMGAPPEMLVIGVALSASYAFIMPVATPPNAIVFSSGYVSIRQMARAGLGLNILAIPPVVLVAWLAAPGLCN